MISSSEYLKSVFENHKVGNINYYVHPFHTFKVYDEEQKNTFNLEMSKEFGVQPIEFDYFVASNTKDIARTLGYDNIFRE